MQRDYTAWAKHHQPTAGEIAAEQEANRQRTVAEEMTKRAILCYEQTFQGRHDGAELVVWISRSESREVAA